MLSQLTPAVLEEYYFTKLQSGLSGSTVRKHHSNIKMALKFAVKNGLTDQNAALLAELPSCNKFCGNFLNTEQFDLVLSKIKHTAIYTPVFIAGTMGLRRSEVWGCVGRISILSSALCVFNILWSNASKTIKLRLYFLTCLKQGQAAAHFRCLTVYTAT